MDDSGTNIFISSTCYDLLDVRAELFAHLKQLGLNPILSDHPGSDFVAGGGGDSIETCLVNLRKCDTVVVILDKRYGGALPGTWAPLSATHVEYQEAVKTGKVILFYVRDHLRGDYDFWLTNKKASGLRFRWAREKRDQQLFALMEEREAGFKSGRETGAEGADNWMWPFRDSLELKDRIARDLEVATRKATMRRLIREGEIPLLSAVQSGNNGTTPNFNITLTLWNAGRVTAMNVRWTDRSGRWRQIGVMPEGCPADNLPYELMVPNATVVVEGKLIVQYDTATGYRILDTHRVVRNPDGSVSVGLKSRELLLGDDYEIL